MAMVFCGACGAPTATGAPVVNVAPTQVSAPAAQAPPPVDVPAAVAAPAPSSAPSTPATAEARLLLAWEISPNKGKSLDYSHNRAQNAERDSLKASPRKVLRLTQSGA